MACSETFSRGIAQSEWPSVELKEPDQVLAELHMPERMERPGQHPHTGGRIFGWGHMAARRRVSLRTR